MPTFPGSIIGTHFIATEPCRMLNLKRNQFDDVILLWCANSAECAIITAVCSSYLVQFGSRRDKCLVSFHRVGQGTS